jgi:glycosyltransferase involved in cell wall biosynthesis
MTEAIRVAHFTVGRCNPDSANGIDKAVSSLSRAQARLGHSVAIFSLTDKEPVSIPGVVVFTHVRGHGMIGQVGSGRLAMHRFTLPEALVRQLIEWRPDVLHLHSVHLPENLVLARRFRRAGIPYGVSIHGGLSALIRKRHRWLKQALRFLGERRHLQAAAFLHAISDQDADGVREYGLKRSVVVVPNGIFLDDVPDRADPELLRRLYPALRDRRVFAFLGRLDTQVKGLDLLLRAFAVAAGPSAALVLIGPGRISDQRELHGLCRQLGMEDSMVFTGPAYGALKYGLLAGADVFVHPSRTEGGLPFSLLEAAAMSKPCLVTPAADPAGMLARYGGGIAVRPDLSSLSDGIARFQAMDLAQLGRLGRNARMMVEKEFDWEPLAARIIGCYRTLALGDV